ncbi:hypothetical protein K8B33_11405 [Alcanivorax sp. JB21]|uniref:hypothetical protein n=1 Tax=Alcanivorax limicola TaxID=2874102 RepID=UPI001CC0C65A|nr:hypothetical protein [Alcanivorax limicola]MBZ2189707.1 hypothetical protein [Alcanivorax limicola]
MDELQRQAWLKAMGFTPWVAATPLPGAAPSVRLAWPASAPATVTAPEPASARALLQPETAGAPPGSQANAPQPDTQTDTQPDRTTESAPGLRKASEALATPVPRAMQQPVARPAPEPQVKPDRGPRFTLQAFATPNVWVVVEQDDADAPDLGRQTQQLLGNLLRVWQVGPGQPRRFSCPLDGQAMTEQDAGLALSAFLQGLARSSNARRVLLCATEATAQLILPERFRAGTGDLSGWLAVSSLAEMLADPATHKRRSWQAIVDAGLHA